MIDLKAIKKQLQNAKAELNMLRAKALDDDIKAIKKQLQNAKAKLNMLRAKAVDDDTMEISSVAPPVPAQSRTKPKVKVERAPPSTPVDKENNENAEHIC
jgi:hypothetical protein